MSTRRVRVATASRLHFGMWSFGRTDRRQFGGVGTMIDRPGLALFFEPAEQFSSFGPLAERVRDFAVRVTRRLQWENLPACRITVAQAPREHAGLGVGTQLGLAVAAGLLAFEGRPAASTAELAALAGRGERSAIGAYGFFQGGLLVEAGKYAGQSLSPLVARVELPAAWRFVLAAPRQASGLSGEAERQAFDRLPSVSDATTDMLCREALTHLVPAAIEGRFDEFSASLARYGRAAGACFAANQGGPFANSAVSRIVEKLASLGLPGASQSSWGPTVFAVAPDEAAGERVAREMAASAEGADADIWLAAPARSGARIDVE